MTGQGVMVLSKKGVGLYKKFFIVRVVKHWLERWWMLQVRMDRALRNLLQRKMFLLFAGRLD